jgi:hypothetical protein
MFTKSQVLYKQRNNNKKDRKFFRYLKKPSAFIEKMVIIYNFGQKMPIDFK